MRSSSLLLLLLLLTSSMVVVGPWFGALAWSTVAGAEAAATAADDCDRDRSVGDKVDVNEEMLPLLLLLLLLFEVFETGIDLVATNKFTA